MNKARHLVMSKRWIQILLSLASLFFGLLIQPLLEQTTSSLINTPIKATLIGMLLVAFAVIVGMNVLLIS